MNNDPILVRLRELSWRRKLTSAEEAELCAGLATHPEAQADWEAETGLNEGLARLPDAPMPSNFTVRVMQAVEHAAAERERAPRWNWSWRLWVPRMAIAVVMISLGLFAYQRHGTVERVKLAQSVAAVLETKSLPSPEVLADFDAIRHLSTPADEELLAALK
jgi:anti-sigma factor RsiW